MKKILLILALVLFSATSALAQGFTPDIPEKSGDYAVPGRNDLRVRVFVHNGNNNRPSITASAQCLDPNVNDVVGPTGWKLPASVSYKVNSNSAPSSVGSSNVVDLTANSFSTWTGKISSNAPTLNYIGSTKKSRKALDGENIISWGKTSGTSLGVTYTWYYTTTKQVVETDTIMNSRVSWTLDQCLTNAYDARNILVHELGHWFGLNDHYTSNYTDNTMFGYGSRAETKKTTLEAGDITGLNNIYR